MERGEGSEAMPLAMQSRCRSADVLATRPPALKHPAGDDRSVWQGRESDRGEEERGQRGKYKATLFSTD